MKKKAPLRSKVCADRTPEERLARLRQMQGYPLAAKVELTKARIREWYEAWEGMVYVAFSGGKDSTVLLDIVWSVYPDVPAVFCDTKNESDGIKDFVRSLGDAVTWIYPKTTYREVVLKEGYPILSKKICMGLNRYKNTKSQVQKDLRLHGGINPTSGRKQQRTVPKKFHHLIDAPFNVTTKCCGALKIEPFTRYEKETGRFPFVGTMADNSELRKQSYMDHGCNAFEAGTPSSRPLMFWPESAVFEYLRVNEMETASDYGKQIQDEDGNWLFDGADRTGCVSCMLGIHMEKGENRAVRMYRENREEWERIYNTPLEEGGLGQGAILDYIGGIPWKPNE